MSKAKEPKIYECGTLRYTTGSLIFTVAMLVLAFFSMSVVGLVVSTTTLKLKSLAASDFIIAFIVTTITGIFNMTVCPIVSFKSDRYRGKRWGRRNIFIVVTIPMICLSLLGFALSDATGTLMAKLINPWFEVSPATLTIAMIGLMMVIYRFFYMFIASVIYYLYNDIIPPGVLARVIGIVQLSTTLASALFNLFLFKYSVSHFSQLMIAGALVYFVGIGAMCLFVKEPKLPPLTDEEQKQSRGATGLKTFMKESFSHRFYWYNFFGQAFWSVGIGVGTFMIFFYTNMGLSLAEYGRMIGIAGIFGFGIGFANATIGALLIDKWHPVRVQIYSFLFIFASYFASIKWLFFDLNPSILFMVFLVAIISGNLLLYISGLSGMPYLTNTMPKSRFGQFCSANSMVRSLMTLFFGLVLGLAIDVTRKLTGQGDFVYRYLFIWQIFWCGLGVLFRLLSYREYIKLGGFTAYKAPAAWSEEKWEDIPKAKVAASSRSKIRLAIRCVDIIVGLYVLVPLAFAIFGSIMESAGSARVFLGCSLPASLVAGVCWFIIRKQILKNYPANDDPVSSGILHHGIIYITGFWLLLLLGYSILQSILVYSKDGSVSAKLWAFEMIAVVVLFTLLFIHNKVEKTAPDVR